MKFFVPFVDPAEAEKVYEDLAHSCQLKVPAPEERIFSIVFRHNGDEWIATVGEPEGNSNRDCATEGEEG